MLRYDDNGKKLIDDFATDGGWETYSRDFYSREIADALGRGQVFAAVNSKVLEDGTIKWNDPVHFHIKWLCEHIGRVRPTSVFECGCGGGQNLHNIGLLFPGIELGGADLVENQIRASAALVGTPQGIVDLLQVADLSAPGAWRELGRWEYVFTNAVLMHLAYDRAREFLTNMAHLSSKWIRITEDLGQHDFPALFRESGVFDEFEIVENNNGVCILRRIE